MPPFSSPEPLESRIAPAFGATFSLSSLNGSNGFNVFGTDAMNYTGWSVSDAGDFNGDGFGDVIVGAPDAAAYRDGEAYVIFGKATPIANVRPSTLNGTNGFKITASPSDRVGAPVSSAGDINGDGFDDLVFGAFTADAPGTDSGAAYILFGKAGGYTPTLSLSSLDGTNGFKVVGSPPKAQAGSSVSSAGDVNGDGLDDIIVSTSQFGYSDPAPGERYVIFGKTTPFGATFDIAALDGRNGFKLMGASVSQRN